MEMWLRGVIQAAVERFCTEESPSKGPGSWLLTSLESATDETDSVHLSLYTVSLLYQTGPW